MMLLRGHGVVVVVAHRSSTVATPNLALVVVLDHGRIAGQGNHRQPLTLGGPCARVCQQFVSSTELGVASWGT
jgi:ABC-type multidrug transport system fused ATPase/permease subunit